MKPEFSETERFCICGYFTDHLEPFPDKEILKLLEVSRLKIFSNSALIFLNKYFMIELGPNRNLLSA